MHSLSFKTYVRQWLLGVGLMAALCSWCPPAWAQPGDKAGKAQSALQKQYPASQLRVTSQMKDGKEIYVLEGLANDPGELDRIRQMAVTELGLSMERDRLMVNVRIQPRGESRTDYVIAINEALILRSPSGRPLERVVVSRANIVQVQPIEQNEVRVVGQQVGITRLTLTDNAKASTDYTIRVEPDLTFVRDMIFRQFPRANVTLTPTRENVVIVSGTVDSAEDIIPLLDFVRGFGLEPVSALRVGGVVQVQLEVCIAKVDRSEFRRMGFNFTWNDQQNFLVSIIGNVIGVPEVTPRGGPQGTIAGEFLTERHNLFFGLTNESWTFGGFLEALRQERITKILANPILTTYSGRPADFLVGGEQPVPVPSSLDQPPTIRFREFGTRLTFVPVVLGDGKIRLEVEPEVTRLNFANGVLIAGTQVPQFEVQRVHATVELESGQTLAIGGFLQTEVDGETFKTPILGDLPFVGAAFRTVRHEERETELIVLVTPRLVDPLDCSQRTTKLPGQETRSPTDFELFLEGILEAPRGPRAICPDGHYQAAHAAYPCGTGCAAGCAAGAVHHTGQVHHAGMMIKESPVVMPATGSTEEDRSTGVTPVPQTGER